MSVARFEVSRQTAVENFGFRDSVPYKMIDAVANYTVDPKDPQNSVIVDLDLAPRDAQGLVHFRGDVRVFRPVDQSRGNGRVLVDVVNRGNSVALGAMNRAKRGDEPGAPDLGDGFLMRHGYTLVQIGWQYDVPPGKGQRLEVPEARAADGKPLTGRITVSFQPNSVTKSQKLFDRGTHKANLPQDVNEQGATLVEWEYENGPSRVIPRGQWSFASVKDGATTPDNTAVYYPEGFKAGLSYQATYTTQGATVIGLGHVAIRDLVSFLRHGGIKESNPTLGVKYVYAFGASQTGRWLRNFLFYGQNLDTKGQIVFDGIIAHVGGGRRGEFNRRFGLQSDQSKRTLSYLFPFTDVEQTDPQTGRKEGLLSLQQKVGGLPKIFFTNGGAEYWGSLASTIHTNIEMTQDVAPGPNVRIYQIAGTQHGSGSLPLTNAYAGTSQLQHPGNTVDYRALLRAALLNLDEWVTSGKEPPPSKHGRIADGTLVPPESLTASFKKIPGATFPEHIDKVTPERYGPGLDPARAEGRAGEPLPVGVGYVNMVSAVDKDGNEVAGIRLPDIAVPLATHMGWNLRGPNMGQPTLMIGLTGSTVPFPVSKAERQISGDPRLSIEERYSSKEDYLAKVEAAAKDLVRQRYMVEEDIENVVKGAALRYDVFTTKQKLASRA